MATQGLVLQPDRWYGWQMLPGYAGERNVPYFSPILVREIVPRKTGRGVLTVRFFNALYAQGVEDFALDLRILRRAAAFLVADVLVGTEEQAERVGIVSHIEFEWLRRFCPGLWDARPPETFGTAEEGSVATYLSSLFPLQ